MSYYSKEERQRYEIFQEFYLCEVEWGPLQVMNENEFKELKDNLRRLDEEVKHIKDRQPDCGKLVGNYEKVFSKYSKEVERIIELNDSARLKIRNSLFSEEKIETLRKTLDSLIKMRNRNWGLLDNRAIEYSTRVIWHLICLRNEVDSDKSNFFPTLEKARQTLDEYNSELYDLLQPTHEWVTSESSVKKSCSKCSAEILLGEKERLFTSEDWQKKRKPVRDPDGYLPQS